MTEDEGFALADSGTSAAAQDALNNSFNSISEMIDEYTNYVTPQDWETFTYSGSIIAGDTIDVGFTVDGSINIWGTHAGTTSYALLGVLQNNKFTPSITAIGCQISQIVRLKL